MRSGRAQVVRLFNSSLALALICLAAAGGGASTAEAKRQLAIAALKPRSSQAPQVASLSSTRTRHYEYVFPNHAMYVYDADHRFRLVQRVPLPGVVGVRGVVASPSTHMLYVSYGAYGGPGTTGRLLAYNLLTDSVVYRRSYSRGVDNMAIDPSGSRIYMPDGEDSHDNVWSVIAAHTGKVIGEIHGGTSPHETIVGLNGKRVYLGGIQSPYLEVASTTTDRVIKRIGPLRAGVRPFTINGLETLAYTTSTRFLGFQVSSITTGHVLYTVRFGARFRRDLNGSRTPSHGISLTPE